MIEPGVGSRSKNGVIPGGIATMIAPPLAHPSTALWPRAWQQREAGSGARVLGHRRPRRVQPEPSDRVGVRRD